MINLGSIIAIIFVVFFLSGIRIVRPTHRGLIERLGKYKRFARAGFNWIIPVIERLYQVNITEVMVDAQPQEIITNDNLNARVDAQVYFKVKDDEDSVKNCAVQRQQLPVADRQPGPDDAPEHHRHPDPEIRQQRAGQDQLRAAEDAARGDEELGDRDRPDRAQGDRPAQGRPGDDEQGRQGREREDRGHRFRHRDRDHGRRRPPGGDQEGRRHQAGPGARGRGRGPGHQARQRGGGPVFRRQRPAPAAPGDGREGAVDERQDRRPGEHRADQRHRRDGGRVAAAPQGRRPVPETEELSGVKVTDA